MAAWNSNGLTVRVTAATTVPVALTDDVVIFTAGTAKTVNILAATDASVQPGKVYRFTNAAAGAVTLTPASGQIDGASTAPLTAGGTAVSCRTLVSDGTMWRTVSYNAGS